MKTIKRQWFAQTSFEVEAELIKDMVAARKLSLDMLKDKEGNPLESFAMMASVLKKQVGILQAKDLYMRWEFLFLDSVKDSMDAIVEVKILGDLPTADAPKSYAVSEALLHELKNSTLIKQATVGAVEKLDAVISYVHEMSMGSMPDQAKSPSNSVVLTNVFKQCACFFKFHDPASKNDVFGKAAVDLHVANLRDKRRA